MMTDNPNKSNSPDNPNKSDKQITIVGAGPVGSYAAKLLAEQGNRVQVIEEHSKIGEPVQCTGIVTKRLGEIVRLRKEFVVNRLNTVRVHAPCGKSVDVKINDIVIDRTEFDKYIAEQAMSKGAKFILNNKVTGVSGKKVRIQNSHTKKMRVLEYDILVGADGPNSIVSRSIGNKKPDCWIGVQAVIKMKKMQMPADSKTYSVYFSDNTPGFFGWVVPQDDTIARVGIATSKNPKKVFEKFMKKFPAYKVLKMQGGLIPKYDNSLILEKKDRMCATYIVGDAATQVKATTGGGLVPGMKAAECLAATIGPAGSGKSYRKELRQVNKELSISLMLRNTLDRFTENDYDKLINIAGDKKISKVLNAEDRDRPSRIVFKSIIKEPKLLLFARTLLRAKRL